jgi:N-acetylneuraminic acid mutarotase
MNAAMVWDSVDQKVLLYGGVGANNRYLNDLWAYSPGAGNWSVIQCTNNRPGPRSANAVWDGQEMLLLGGMNRGGVLADFWSYDLTRGWQKLADTTPMGGRAYQTLVWDTTDSRLYVFGGLDTDGLQHNDFWMYSTNNGWVMITPRSQTNPLGRQQGMGAWDSKHNMLLLFGGWEDGQGVPFFGLWVYDPKQNAWDLLTPLDSSGAHIIPGRTDGAMVWDATDQQAYIYAGAGNGKSGSSLKDLWVVT